MENRYVPERVPVRAGPRCIEMADPSRVRHLLQAPNMRAIRRHKDRRLVGLQVLDVGDDSHQKPRRGNPLQYSHNHETEDNPSKVWTLKPVPDEARQVIPPVLKGAA